MNKRLHARLLAVAGAVMWLSACGGGGEAAPEVNASTARDVRASATGVPATSLAPGPANLSGNVTCTNQAIGAVNLDSVVVAPNSACKLEGTVLVGKVQVGSGASLEAVGIRAAGGVQADGAAHVALSGASHIGGSVQIVQGGSAHVNGNTITGDLQFDLMSGSVAASGNQIGGSLQAFGNLGGVTMTDNRMSGNLQCGENLPLPSFSGNIAASADGQCLGGNTGGSSGGGAGGNPPPLPSPAPLSGNVTCVGLAIGALRLDSVIVPAGASCTLQDTVLNGSIEVGANARLIANGVQVTGGLVADGAAELTLGSASSVGGSVQIARGGPASITGAAIRGDLQVDDMRGNVSLSTNRVGGNFQAMANRGGLQVLGNAFGGVMQCKDNLPAPTGSGNTATLKEDQCLGL